MPRSLKGRRRLAVGPGSMNAIAADIAGLAELPIDTMKQIWCDRIGEELPNTRSQTLFRRLLAWELQAAVFGGLDAVTEKKLRDIANAVERERDGQYEPKVRRGLPIGVVLTREWKGAVHKVTIVADGFAYQRREYKSLSDIARTITGTRWSGPRFFGLEQKTGKPRRPSAKETS